MQEHEDQSITATVEEIYRRDSRRVLATLIRLLGDFDLAEEALHDAFAVALRRWCEDGIPSNPVAWLVSTGRFRAIDSLRQRARFDRSISAVADRFLTDRFHTDPSTETLGGSSRAQGELEDDRLRLIFTCCHPALTPDAQVALTLRELCGLTTEEIARAFLSRPPTIAQRIVRAKAKIRDAKIPYEVPDRSDLSVRLESVLRVIYLVFNEGYSASSGEAVTRSDLSSEAIRLGRLLVQLLPDPEAIGLLALMLLHDSRRLARSTDTGDLILLEDQDRSRWDRDQIEEGCALVARALKQSSVPGRYALQAAIAAVHAEAPVASATDWPQIVALYGLLLKVDPSPVVELNRAGAVAMREGPSAGLVLIDALFERGHLEEFHLAHAARADLCRRLGMREEAAGSYRRALALVRQEPERRFLEQRLAELTD